MLPKVLQQRREIEKAPNLVAAHGRGEWRTPQSADVKLDSINMREVTCMHLGCDGNMISQELPILCNETTAIREFGTAQNCLQNMAVSLAAS